MNWLKWVFGKKKEEEQEEEEIVIGEISEELADKFAKANVEIQGIKDSITHLSKQIGRLEQSKQALWIDVYEELGLDPKTEGKRSMTMNHRTRQVTEVK